MEVDTLRALVDWKCNLRCSYCCNEQQRFRSQIKAVRYADVEWGEYPTLCISGGEPLIFPERVRMAAMAAPNAFKILYTNGTLWTRDTGKMLDAIGIQAVNVGLHFPSTFDGIIAKVRECTTGLKIEVRFHVWENYRDAVLETHGETVKFKFWKMDDCDRENEKRIVVTDWPEGH